MNVLFYVHSLGAGGAERVTATIANHWARAGWPVLILTDADIDHDFYELDPSIERLSLHADHSSRGFWSAIVNNWRRIRDVRKILTSRSPDAAIGMMTKAACVLAIAGKGLPVRLIGSERIHPPMYPLGKAWGFVRRKTYPLLDRVVAQTQSTAAWLEKHVPGSEVSVIANPVSLPLQRTEPCLDPESIRKNSGGARMLLAVGRLDSQKGFDQLLRAFADLPSLSERWCLVILGEGSCRAALEGMVREAGNGDRVFMPGGVGNIGDWYAAADLFVLSSRYEGFPNCLLEALAHGLPAIAVDCETGPREIVRDEIDALLVPAANHDRLTEAMHRLMNDKNKRRALAEKAGEVRDRYSVDVVASQWARLLATGEAND